MTPTLPGLQIAKATTVALALPAIPLPVFSASTA